MGAKMNLSALGVTAALLVGLVSAGVVIDDAIHAFEVKEQPIWNQEWSVGQTYYSAWAMLESCIHDETFKSLDIMRYELQSVYEPAANGKTMFQLMEGSKLVSPLQPSDTVEDSWWPYARNELAHASETCVTSKEDYCCCKDRATWNLYARYTTKAAASDMYRKMAEVKDWHGTLCIAMDQGGLFEEKLEGDGYFSRKPISPSSRGPSAGAIVGWVFLALILAALIALVAFVVYKKRTGGALGFALWTSDPEPESKEEPEAALAVDDFHIDEAGEEDITVTNPMADAPAPSPSRAVTEASSPPAADASLI